MGLSLGIDARLTTSLEVNNSRGNYRRASERQVHGETSSNTRGFP